MLTIPKNETFLEILVLRSQNPYGTALRGGRFNPYCNDKNSPVIDRVEEYEKYIAGINREGERKKS